MVISQIAGLATAFGTGELSGAGFGPNYTILMKLGYEFFAPRILEEMEKNPNVFFQDTLWFQKFQKQIKLYSDKVMAETLESLLSIPQATIDAIQKKFGPGGTSGNILTENLIGNVQGGLDIVTAVTEAISKISFNFNIGGGLIGQTAAGAPGHGTSGTLPNQPLTAADITSGQLIADQQHGPVQGALTQQQIFDSTNDYFVYRQKGGLLSPKGFAFNKNVRQRQIKQFQKVTIPKSNIPKRSTVRKAGQSVKIERNKLIRDIAGKARQLRIVSSKTFTSASKKIIQKRLIKEIKLLQQKLKFLLRNFDFGSG